MAVVLTEISSVFLYYICFPAGTILLVVGVIGYVNDMRKP